VSERGALTGLTSAVGELLRRRSVRLAPGVVPVAALPGLLGLEGATVLVDLAVDELLRRFLTALAVRDLDPDVGDRVDDFGVDHVLLTEHLVAQHAALTGGQSMPLDRDLHNYCLHSHSLDRVRYHGCDRCICYTP